MKAVERGQKRWPCRSNSAKDEVVKGFFTSSPGNHSSPKLEVDCCMLCSTKKSLRCKGSCYALPRLNDPHWLFRLSISWSHGGKNRGRAGKCDSWGPVINTGHTIHQMTKILPAWWKGIMLHNNVVCVFKYWPSITFHAYSCTWPILETCADCSGRGM